MPFAQQDKIFANKKACAGRPFYIAGKTLDLAK